MSDEPPIDPANPERAVEPLEPIREPEPTEKATAGPSLGATDPASWRTLAPEESAPMSDVESGVTAPSIPGAPGSARPSSPGFESDWAFAGYQLMAPLGQGGMGIVWKARQAGLNRFVALKMVLGEHRADAKELIRFLAEAEAVAAVRHPNVVQVFDYGEASGRPFLAMEYLAGGSLAARLSERGRLEPREAAELVATLARAVDAAHALGIVHRDLKPGNILFDDLGRPKVTDFGLAKRPGATDLTATLAVMGTPAYMAPEQARGKTRFVGPQADVYALGVILHECLAGLRPFHDADPLELLRKVAEEEPQRLARLVPGLPCDLDLIVSKCLAKEANERYPTAGALAADLERFLAGEPVSVRSIHAVERLARWARRKPTLAAAYALGLLAALLGGLGGLALWQWRVAEHARGIAVAARGEAEHARDGEAHARAEAEKARDGQTAARAEAELQRDRVSGFSYGKTVEVAHQEWREGNGPSAVSLLEATPPERRGWEWSFVDRLCHAEIASHGEHESHLLSARFGPDGASVVTASDDGVAKVWDARTQALRATLRGHAGAVRVARVSPDGSRVVTGGADGTVRIWACATGLAITTLRGHEKPVRTLEFSPDRNALLTGGDDGTVRLWDLQTSREMLRIDTPWPVVAAAFSPDGRRIVTGGGSTHLTLWDARSGEEIRRIDGHGGYSISAVGFSPDGATILSAGDDRTARLWNANTGAPILTLRGHIEEITSASFSRDGKHVLTADRHGTARIWDAGNGAPRFVIASPEAILDACFAPDGRTVLTAGAGRSAKLWDVTRDPEAVALRGHDDGVRSAVFSPDGRHIATASDDKTARVWDANTGDTTRMLGGHDAMLLAVAWSPDGRRLATGDADGSARIWDAATGALVQSRKVGKSTASLAFSRDGARLISRVDLEHVVIWDWSTGDEVLKLERRFGWINAAVLSPDGRLVATAEENGQATLWDARTGAELRALKHDQSVRRVAFRADGGLLACGLDDGLIVAWDMASGAEIRRFQGHLGEIVTLGFSPTASGWSPEVGIERRGSGKSPAARRF